MLLWGHKLIPIVRNFAVRILQKGVLRALRFQLRLPLQHITGFQNVIDAIYGTWKFSQEMPI